MTHKKRIGLGFGLVFAFVVGQIFWAMNVYAFPNPQANTGTQCTSPPASTDNSPPVAVNDQDDEHSRK